MRERKKKNILKAIVSILLLTLFLTISVHADSRTVLEAENTDGESVETENDSAEDTVYSLLRGSDLSFGTAGVRKLSSSEINVNGHTQCHHVCDNVYVYLYLERKVNGTYSTYKYWKFSTTNATNIDKSINVIVPSGYYYRVSGYHSTYNDGRKESISTLSDAIWIG